MDRKVAFNRKFVNSHLRDASRFEGQNLELLDVEEIRALQVRIALRVSGVNRRGIDRGHNS